MSDEGEKVCPLCTEEMDLTDQQLRPCRCGYQVCVWCWHHIMEMAEKDNTEGRCPACRTPYDKEKIVGTAANCERLVAEISSERKIKSNKAKSKTDGRMRLSTVRVIQRNLVYIIGIPSNLADEDALQHKEYFGKYGKVLKVSISRTAGGAIQHSSNNTCSVYITYSKEEEAVRCIQSVHGYTLDGKPLRACFGTTKYCHAWLRNMSCSNPDCLYLHEIGTEEDSFSQDKIISAYTRSRAQQMTAASNNLDRRSGSMLPPPFDDFCIDDTESMGKPIPRSVPNISAPQPQIKTSPPNSSSGRSPVLPAAASWGLRASSGRHPATSSSSSDGLVNQKPDGSFSSVVASSTQTSTLHNDAGKRPVVNEESQALHFNDKVKPLESSKQNTFRDSKATEPDSNAKVMCIAAPASASSDNHISSRPASRHSETVVTTPPVEDLEFSGNEMGIKMPPEGTSPCRTASDAEDENVAVNGTVDNLCSGLASIGLGNHPDAETGDAHVLIDKVPTQQSFNLHKDQGMQQYHLEDISDHTSSVPSRKFITPDGVSFSTEQTGWSTELSSQVIPEVRNQVKEETSAFNEQSLKFPEPTHPLYSFNSSNSFKTSNHYSGHPFQLGDMCSASNLGNTVTGTVQKKVDEALPPFEYRNFLGSSVFNLNKVVNSPELTNSFHYSNFPSNMDDHKYRGRLNNTAVGSGGGNGAVDMGESSIISNILSMDDVWSDSLTSSRDLAQLFSDTDRQNDSVKAQNNNQSRFSFARQEDVGYQRSSVEPSYGSIGSMANIHSSFQGLPENRDPYLDRHRNGFSSNFPGEPESFLSSQFSLPSDRLSAARGQISAPPGFSHPSRPAPPGFSSHERLDQTFDTLSGHHLFENSSMLRNQYPQPTNSIDDPEFIDPAILFVGKGRRPNGMNSLNGGLDMRSTYTPQRSVSPEDLRLQQLLMQQSISTHQNLRYSDHIGDRFPPVTDAYNRTPSRFPEQSQITNPLLFSQSSFHQPRNGHYDGWNEVQNGNNSDFAMAELLRNERLGGGFNKQHYPSYEDLKYRMPSSGDIYNNRAFGM